MSEHLMKTFVDMAERADIVTIDSGAYCHFSWDKVQGERDNALLRVNWHDDEGQEYSCVITEEAFEAENHPSFKDGIWRVIDSDGDPSVLRFYRLELLKE